MRILVYYIGQPTKVFQKAVQKTFLYLAGPSKMKIHILSYTLALCLLCHWVSGYESPVGSFLSCPVLEDDVIGLCSDMCQSDSDCTSGQKCCRNGCGALACLDSVPIPYISPSRECPEEFDQVICDIQECTDSCEDPNQLCCQNDCGSQVCVDGELPPFPCTKTVNGLTGETLLGQFIPKCDEEDGTFSKLQCWSHYCWCVDGQSGQPTSVMVESGSVGELECSRCSHEQNEYNHGEVVDYHGDCAKSKCIAGELVRTEECDQCVDGEHTYDHGETLENDCLCSCWDGGIVCARSADGCYYGTYSDSDPDRLEWWHISLIATGTATVSIIVITTVLTVVVVIVIKRFCCRRKKLPNSSEMLSFDADAPILGKNGLPEAESTEFKVLIEDDADPVNT